MKRALALAAALTAVVGIGGTTAATAKAPPATIDLPAGYRPEGIALDRGSLLVGSIPTGAVLRVDPRDGSTETAVAGRPGVAAAIGLKADSKHRIFVSGGPTGKAFVYSPDGKELAAFTLNPSADTFINDVTLSGPFAYFTDSRKQSIFRVRRDRKGVTEIPTPAIPLLAGNNLNGIAVTRDGHHLLAIQSSNGVLWRIDARTGAAVAVDLGGAVLTAGDGLLLEGHRLFVVQNRLNQIAVVHLSPAYSAGAITRTITSAAFDVPTTIVRKGGDLFLPNARFGIADADTAAYAITRVAAK